MGIRVNTEDRFEASIRSWLTGILLTVLGTLFAAIGFAALSAGEAQGAIFAVIGVGMAGLGVWLLSRRTLVAFDRNGNSARITVASLAGSRNIDLPLDAVERAVVQKRRSSGNRRLYKLVLAVPEGDHAGTYSLTGGYSSGGWPKGRMARAINAWLGVEDD